nr:hypothetical protein [Mesobacterium pallidum]
MDAALLAAHAARDNRALVGLYAKAAALRSGDARWFFLTQAHVLALEAGDPRAETLRAELAAAGREAPAA